MRNDSTWYNIVKLLAVKAAVDIYKETGNPTRRGLLCENSNCYYAVLKMSQQRDIDPLSMITATPTPSPRSRHHIIVTALSVILIA